MKLLLADDETELTRALCAIFKHKGYETDVADNGTDALGFALANMYDAIILDIMMPGMSGLDVLRSIRDNNIETPVILLTAKTEIDDRIIGLDTGANDYLTKPFAVGELLARVRALTRAKETTLSFGNIMLDLKTNELKGECSSLRISDKEASVLSILIKNTKKNLVSKNISNEIWGTDGGELTIYISYLRNKLGALNADFVISEADGYILEATSQTQLSASQSKSTD